MLIVNALLRVIYANVGMTFRCFPFKTAKDFLILIDI